MLVSYMRQQGDESYAVVAVITEFRVKGQQTGVLSFNELFSGTWEECSRYTKYYSKQGVKIERIEVSGMSKYDNFD